MEICKTRIDYENEQMVLEHPTKMFPEHGSYVKLEYYKSLQKELSEVKAQNKHLKKLESDLKKIWCHNPDYCKEILKGGE